MDSKQADKLLEKYFAGETSISEEKWLQEYFSQEDNPQPGQKYAGELFRYFRQEATLKYVETDNARLRFSRISLLKIAAAAAVFLILAGTLFFMTRPDEPVAYAYINGVPITDQDMATDETQKVLSLISEKLNKSTADLAYLSKLTDIEEKFTKQE